MYSGGNTDFTLALIRALEHDLAVSLRPIFAVAKPFLAILFALTLAAARTLADDSPISVSLAIPAQWGGRALENYQDGHPTHFHVIVSNVSGQPQRIWQEWCSWGYFGLTFELTDDQGKKWVAQKCPRDWDKNFPSTWTLDPHESLALDVYFTDTNIWQGFPMPRQSSQTVTMQAVLEFKPDDNSRQIGVWTGRAVSKAEKVAFYPDAR